MNWLNKGKEKESKNNDLKVQEEEKDKVNPLEEEKINDSWDNYEDNLLQDKKDATFDDTLKDISLNKSSYLINTNNNNINEKDDEYTVENLDDNIENYFSDDSFDLSNMLSTQSEGTGSQMKRIPKITEEEEEDDNMAISIPKTKKNKKKSVFLEDEAVESEDEDLRNLGIIKDKTQDDEEDDDEDDSNIVYSGDEDEINTNDVDKIIELHRKQMKDKDEKDMSAIINGVTTGNFRKRKRLNDEELEKGYDLSDDDLDIHGLRSLRNFVNRVDPHSHKHKRYKHKGALAIYASKIETAPFAKCFEINTDSVEIAEETNNFSDFETETQEAEDVDDEDKVLIEDSDDDDEVDQLNKEIEELKDDRALMDGEYTTTLTIKKFEPSKLMRKESSDLREIEENMNEVALQRASSTHTVEDFLNTSNIKRDFDILKYINKSVQNNKNKDNIPMFTEPDIIDPLLVNYKRKTPRMGSLLNKKEEELDRLRKFDSNLELNLGSSRKNVIGGMFSSTSSSSMNIEMDNPMSNDNTKDNRILKDRSNTNNSMNRSSSVRPIGLLKALSKVNSSIF